MKNELDHPPNPPNFEKLVLGSIDASDSETSRMFLHCSRFTIFVCFCTAQLLSRQTYTHFQSVWSFLFEMCIISIFFSFFFNLKCWYLSKFREQFQKMMKRVGIPKTRAHCSDTILKLNSGTILPVH